MNSFTGKAKKTLDEKDRVVLPKEMRLLMDSTDEGRVMLARGNESCIALYTLDVWSQKEKRVKSLDETKRKNRRYQRMFFADAKSEKIDSLGRIRLPRPLMEIAGIGTGDGVTINGAGKHIEIWNSEVLDEYLNAPNGTFEDLEEEVFNSVEEEDED